MPTVSIWQCEAAGLWLDILWMIPLIMDIVREECSELKCIAFSTKYSNTTKYSGKEKFEPFGITWQSASVGYKMCSDLGV